MPFLTPGVTINSGDIVTRQTIYDVLALAGLSGNVQTSDLSADMITVTTQSLPPSNPPPGLVWFDQTEQLLKVWTDYLDGTAVSVWLAMGPDAFDVALLAAEPIPYGAAVVPAPNLGLRVVTTPTDPGSQASMAAGANGWTNIGRFYNLQFLGINQDIDPTAGPYVPHTTASGSWFPARIYGRAICWAPGSRGTPALDAAMTQTYLVAFLSGASGLTNPSGISNFHGAVGDTGSDWSSGNKMGGCWGYALRDVRPHHATLTQHHYGEVFLHGPRFKG